jgi:hypothetical protein
MKASIQTLLVAFLICASFSSCATSSSYDAKVETWKGASVDSLVQAWGQPDSVESLHTGNKMYVYARLKREPVTYSQFQTRAASNGVAAKPRAPASSNNAGGDTGIYIHCATYFEVDRQNTIDSVMFRGDECK